MPPYDPRAYVKLMFWSISFLLICTYLFADEVTTKDKVIDVLEKIEQVEKDGDKVYWNKITEIKPKNTDDQYCFIKVIIKESDNQIIKEEILECADGRNDQTPQLIGNYSLSFTKRICINQNTVVNTIEKDMLLRRQEKYV